MVEIRMQGPTAGSNLGIVSVSQGGQTETVEIGAFGIDPSATSGDAVTLIFGQSNAAFLAGSNAMQTEVAALGGGGD